MAKGVLVCNLEKMRRERPGSPTYYSWKAQFTITARKDERELFGRIKKFFGCGNVYVELDKEIHYCVSNIDDLKNIISPFFQKYQLQGKKRFDFALWAEAIDIISRNKKMRTNSRKGYKGFSKNCWNNDDLKRLIQIHDNMQKYKANRPNGLKHIYMARALCDKF